MTGQDDIEGIRHALEHAGLRLDVEQEQELATAYAQVTVVAARLRKRRSPMAELAHCYKPVDSR